MKDFGKCMRLLPYVFEFKTNLVSAIFIWILGIALMLLVQGTSYSNMVGPIYLVLAPMMLTQLCSTLLLSQMIGASPKRKKLDLWVSNIVTIISVASAFAIIVIYYSMQIAKAPEQVDMLIKMLFYFTISSIVLSIYFAVCGRGLLLSGVLFLLFCIGIAVIMELDFVTGIIVTHFAGNWVRTIIECVILLAVGVVGSCFIRKVMYKVAISQYCGGYKLRKVMQ